LENTKRQLGSLWISLNIRKESRKKKKRLSKKNLRKNRRRKINTKQK